MTATEATTAQPSRWSRMAATGLFMAALGPLLLFAAGTIWGLEFNFFVALALIAAAIGLAAGFALLRVPGKWPKVVGIVASVLIVGALWFTIFGITAVNSFFDFVPAILVIPGGIIGLVGSIAGIVATRRGKASVAPADGEVKTMRTALTVVVALAAVSGVLTFVGKETVDEGQADVQVALKDFEFDQSSYSLDGGTTVLVRNDDPFLHTFTVTELDIDETLTPGSEVLVEIPDSTGDYLLFCDPHTADAEDPTDDDMTADLTVQ